MNYSMDYRPRRDQIRSLPGTEAKLAQPSEIAGLWTIEPKGMFIWNEIKLFIDQSLRKMNVQEWYFPMLVRSSTIAKEFEHITGFTPELAWISRSTASSEPLAILPTSESIIYSHLAQTLRSRRQLPLSTSQWCNVLRWETKESVPFIRTREFLWQEGHSLWETQAEATAQIDAIIDMYSRVYRELLAVPLMRGTKSRKETFAGARRTT